MVFAALYLSSVVQTEAEFLDVIGTKSRQSSLLAIHSHLYLSKSGLKLVCKVNIVYGNLKSENSQDYAQKPQRNCTFMNSASVQLQVVSPILNTSTNKS